MSWLRTFLQGKKVYLVCATGILTVITTWAAGQMSGMDAFLTILAALGAAAGKAGITRDIREGKDTPSEAAKRP